MNNHTSKEISRLNHLISEIEAVYHETSLKFGLSDSEMQILYTIFDNGDKCPLRDICYLTGISKQTLNSALRKLESKDIIYLEPIGAKGKLVCFTESGKQLAEHTVVKLIRAENNIFSSWDIGDVEKYLELTKRYLNSLKEETHKIES